MTEEPNHPEHPEPLSPERQEEFVLLLNATHGLLLRYVMSLVANRHDAEDVLQRASVVMWRRFATFEALLAHLADNQIDTADVPVPLGLWLEFDPVAEKFTGEFASAASRLAQDDCAPAFELPKIG